MTAVEQTKVKICGITTLGDARLAIEAGAEMLGFNFYKRSVRYIAPEAAREIVERVKAEVECVGVFVNERAEEVIALVEAVGLSTAQLHGDESPEYCAEVARACGLIKALRVGDDFRPESAARFDGRVLLDAASAQFGGSGNTFDWKLAASMREHVRELILAGGLHEGNVGEAIAVASPDAVDACSGLECAPGKKDREKVMAFMAAVREADAQKKAKVLSA